MWYGLVFIPVQGHAEVRQFRKKYDPTFPMLEKEHMTIMYPVPESVGYKNLDAHLVKILHGRQPLRVHFHGLRKSWDHWLLLDAREGSDAVIELHDNLYTGLLKPYLREDLPYHPCLSLGLFAEDDYDPLNPEEMGLKEDEYESAYREANGLNFDFWSKIDRLTLVGLTSMEAEIEIIKEYPLRKHE